MPLPRQRFDLYRPPGLAPDAPLLVFIHGGAWRAGSRGDYRFLGFPLAAMGCLVAIPDYRLWPEAAFPSFVEDTALALRALGLVGGDVLGEVRRFLDQSSVSL